MGNMEGPPSSLAQDGLSLNPVSQPRRSMLDGVLYASADAKRFSRFRARRRCPARNIFFSIVLCDHLAMPAPRAVAEVCDLPFLAIQAQQLFAGPRHCRFLCATTIVPLLPRRLFA